METMKEGELAVLFRNNHYLTVTKQHDKLFTLVTDHKALAHIFGSQRAIPEMSASRITRWSLFQMNYQYVIEYRNTKEHCNADMLSRLPMSTVHRD